MQEKNSLDKVIERLESKVNKLSALQGHQSPMRTGVPLKSLTYLCCPHCQVPLGLQDVEMNHKYVYNGLLTCNCGYHASIKDGVVLTTNKNTSAYDQPDLEREFYLDIPPALVSLFKKSYNWMMDKLDVTKLKDKVVLETHINAYFFMYNHITDMDPEALYIVVDKFPEIIDMYKRRIEHLNPKLNILYIADNSLNLPIRKGMVDLFIDYFSTNENCFYSQDYLIPELRAYFHKDTAIIGTYFYFDPGSKSIENLCSKYPEATMNNFNLTYFKSTMKDTHFLREDDFYIGTITNSGNNRAFSFHEDGESMHMYSYYAKK